MVAHFESLQFVRISGSTRPSKANEAAFQAAVDALLDTLETQAPPKSREQEAAKARARAARRFGAARS